MSNMLHHSGTHLDPMAALQEFKSDRFGLQTNSSFWVAVAQSKHS